ncbi:MAG: hypothetical protein M3480_10395 [Verrucomicrobiota bacterium]|nr:hypothetical protein [Verrucomicrobiota bacterium]
MERPAAAEPAASRRLVAVRGQGLSRVVAAAEAKSGSAEKCQVAFQGAEVVNSPESRRAEVCLSIPARAEVQLA